MTDWKCGCNLSEGRAVTLHRFHRWGESAQEGHIWQQHLRLNTPTHRHRNPAVVHLETLESTGLWTREWYKRAGREWRLCVGTQRSNWSGDWLKKQLFVGEVNQKCVVCVCVCTCMSTPHSLMTGTMWQSSLPLNAQRQYSTRWPLQRSQVSPKLRTAEVSLSTQYTEKTHTHRHTKCKYTCKIHQVYYY